MKKIKLNDKNLINEFIKTINSGGLVIYPTETCYGIGADATNSQAVSQLLKYKNRPTGKAISVAVGSKNQVFKLIKKNPQAKNIIENFLPGPITLVGESLKVVDGRLENEVGTLGIRIPAHEKMLMLLQKLGKPITATSANISGQSTPYDLKKLLNTLSRSKKDMISLVIDADELEPNPPSLVIDTTRNNKVYRGGLISPEDIENGESMISSSSEETKEIAGKLISEILKEYDKKKNILILLHGELGAGKTQFAQGIGTFFNINEVIKSPSFVIMNEYKFDFNKKFNGMFYHIDLWRTDEQTSLSELGVKFCEKGDKSNDNYTFIAVEWPDNLNLEESFNSFQNNLSDNLVVVSVKFLKLGENRRRLLIRFIKDLM